MQSFEDVELIQEAFVAGRCDGWSSDTSQLTGLRSNYPDGPEALTILDEVFSKEPLAPAVADGDTRWAQAVEWAIYATIQAEEFGIDSTNVGDMAASEDDLNIQRFLGRRRTRTATTLDTGLGLPTDFNLPGRHPGRQLRRDLREPPRPTRVGARRQRVVDRGRVAVRAAVPLIRASS